MTNIAGTSHPTRVRGLKPMMLSSMLQATLSHPTRVRGLKLCHRAAREYNVESHPTRVRGLKLHYIHLLLFDCLVAPHAGAWIETWRPWLLSVSRSGSHPTRVRGLKLMLVSNLAVALCVAPHAGAWIEMGRLERSCKPACHDAPLRIHDLKLPAKEYPKAGLKQKSPHGVFRKGFLLFPGAGEGT